MPLLNVIQTKLINFEAPNNVYQMRKLLLIFGFYNLRQSENALSVQSSNPVLFLVLLPNALKMPQSGRANGDFLYLFELIFFNTSPSN